MDTKIWTDESDKYTIRAEELHSDIYNTNDVKFFANKAHSIINKFQNNTENILDVGCAYGASIYNLKSKFTNCNFFGIDPGKDTIEKAKKNINDKKVHFTNGFSHNLPYDDDKFDVIIFSMVLQWIPRKYLIKTLSEVDRVLKDNGLIYIFDFIGNKPITSPSKHDDEIYIFKDDYGSFFSSFPWYKEVYKEVSFIEEGEDQQRVVTILKKYTIKEVYTMKNSEKETKNE